MKYALFMVELRAVVFDRQDLQWIMIWIKDELETVLKIPGLKKPLQYSRYDNIINNYFTTNNCDQQYFR